MDKLMNGVVGGATGAPTARHDAAVLRRTREEFLHNDVRILSVRYAGVVVILCLTNHVKIRNYIIYIYIYIARQYV